MIIVTIGASPAEVIGHGVHGVSGLELVRRDESLHGDVACGHANVKARPVIIAPATRTQAFSIPPKSSPASVAAASCRGDLGAEQRTATTEPVGRDARPRAEHQRTGELRERDETDGEHGMRQLVCEDHLGAVREPGSEVGGDAAEEIPAKAAIASSTCQGVRRAWSARLIPNLRPFVAAASVALCARSASIETARNVLVGFSWEPPAARRRPAANFH